MRANKLSILAALIAVLATVVAIAVSSSDSGHGAPVVTAQAKNGPTVEVPKPVYDQATKGDLGHHENLRDESMATPQNLKHNDAKASPLTPRIEGAVPLASPNQAGCLTRQISRNFSYRTGVRPTIIVIHYTVSRNVFGWNDVNAIFVWFSNSAASASSNFVVDGEGHCIYLVPEAYKAWAQAGLNSATACSIETIDMGDEARLLSTAAGEKQMGRMVRDCAKRWHIPLRRGSTSGCNVTRSGVVDHKQLGLCGGGHHDIGKFSVKHVITLARHAGSAPKPLPVVPTKVVKACAGLTRYRLYKLKLAKLHKRPGAGATKLAVRRARTIKAAGYVCGRHGSKPVLRKA